MVAGSIDWRLSLALIVDKIWSPWQSIVISVTPADLRFEIYVGQDYREDLKDRWQEKMRETENTAFVLKQVRLIVAFR